MKASELLIKLRLGIEKYGDKDLYFHNSSDGEGLELVDLDYENDGEVDCFFQFNNK